MSLSLVLVPIQPLTASMSRPPIDLRFFLEITDNITLITGLIFNFTLLYLILWKTEKNMMKYKIILLQNCLIDTFYNIVNALMKPILDFKSGIYIISFTGFLSHLSDIWTDVSIMIWAFSVVYCVTSLPVQFLYRYFLIARNHKLSKCQYFLMLFIAFLFAFTYACFTFVAFWPNDRRPEILNLLRADVYYYQGIPSFVFSDIRLLPLRGLLSYCLVICGLSYSIVILANYRVFVYLKSVQGSLSSTVLQVQSQIHKTFIIQALVPITTSGVPIITAITILFSLGTIPGLGIIISFLFSLIPVANPLCTLIFIKQYRMTILRWFKNVYQRRGAVSAVSSGIRTFDHSLDNQKVSRNISMHA